MKTYVKDPGDTLSYSNNWEPWLDGDTISISAFAATTGITIVSDSNTTTTSTVILSGGIVNNSYTITNTITTAGGSIVERSFKITVKQR